MGEGWGEGAVSPSNVIRIDSSTESIPSSTSLFQYRITLNPRELSHAVLDASDVRCSWWWPPSISMTSLLSGQTKSTMYLPIGDCLLNLRPNSLRSRSLDQRSRSASVDWFLSSPSPQPSPIKGEGVAQRSPSAGMTSRGRGKAQRASPFVVSLSNQTERATSWRRGTPSTSSGRTGDVVGAAPLSF